MVMAASCDVSDSPSGPRGASSAPTFRLDPGPVDELECEPGSYCDGDDEPYAHPFQGVELIDGQVPLLDIKDSPQGKRYMVMSSVFQAAEGAPVEHFSGTCTGVQPW